MFIIVNMEEWRAAVCFVTLSLAINDRYAARSTVTLLCTLYCSLMYYPLPVQELLPLQRCTFKEPSYAAGKQPQLLTLITHINTLRWTSSSLVFNCSVKRKKNTLDMNKFLMNALTYLVHFISEFFIKKIK